MNRKKLLMFGIPILALALVAAAVIYYSVTINVTADITEPFVTSVIPLSFSGIATDDITEDISITNNAQAELPATITWTPRNLDIFYNMEITALNGNPIGPLDLTDGPQVVPIPNGANTITLTFSTPEAITVGALHLSQKDLSDWISYGETADITYTKIGSTFHAEGIPEGYTLVYYPNVGTYETYTGEVYKVEGSNKNLPFEDDLNGGEESSDYCDNGFNPGVTICEGAKLWLVPNEALSDEANEDGSYTVDWNEAENFLFETGLITYTKVTSNSIGTITVERLPE